MNLKELEKKVNSIHDVVTNIDIAIRGDINDSKTRPGILTRLSNIERNHRWIKWLVGMIIAYIVTQGVKLL